MKKLISILLALALLVSCITALAEAEPEEYACREENFSTRIPAGTSAAYEEGTGLMIYARSEGKIPYVIVSRRPMDMKFQSPENYLNNVFREYMEDKYTDNFRGMNPAKAWEAGGKELLIVCLAAGAAIFLINWLMYEDGATDDMSRGWSGLIPVLWGIAVYRYYNARPQIFKD